MSKNTQKNPVMVSFGIDELPKFSVESFRHISREQRIDQIVESVSNDFSNDLVAIIKDAKSLPKGMKKATRAAPIRKKAAKS